MADIDSRLALNQYGFCPGRETVDTVGAVIDIAKETAKELVQDRHLCILVTFDIENIF